MIRRAKTNNNRRAAHISLNSEEYHSVLLSISVFEVEKIDNEIKWADFTWMNGIRYGNVHKNPSLLTQFAYVFEISDDEL